MLYVKKETGRAEGEERQGFMDVRDGSIAGLNVPDHCGDKMYDKTGGKGIVTNRLNVFFIKNKIKKIYNG